MLKLDTKMLKFFPMRNQLSHRGHPLHPSSIRDVRSLLRIRDKNLTRMNGRFVILKW